MHVGEAPREKAMCNLVTERRARRGVWDQGEIVRKATLKCIDRIVWSVIRLMDIDN